MSYDTLVHRRCRSDDEGGTNLRDRSVKSPRRKSYKSLESERKGGDTDGTLRGLGPRVVKEKYVKSESDVTVWFIVVTKREEPND